MLVKNDFDFNASIAYWEHVGWNLHCLPKTGERINLYPFIR